MWKNVTVNFFQKTSCLLKTSPTTEHLKRQTGYARAFLHLTTWCTFNDPDASLTFLRTTYYSFHKHKHKQKHSLVQKKRWSFYILNPLFSVRSPIVVRIFLDFLASNHPDFRRFLTWNPVYLIPCVSSALFSFFFWLSTSFSSFSK